jgi:hypothetical protein
VASATGTHTGTATAGRLTPAEALHVLELPPTATVTEVHAAYRRLAFRYHPDRNRDDAACFINFKQVTRAYRLLQAWFRLDGRDGSAGYCARCNQLAPLRVGLDRRGYCRHCLMFAAGPPALPGPAVVIATCGFTIIMLTLACVFLVLGASRAHIGYSAAALACGLIGSVALAITAVIVAEVHRRRKRAH